MSAVLIVSGFPRCGSSLTMQMLHAGGMRCVGEPPAFEDMRTSAHGPIDERWFSTLGSRAVKVLEPALNRIPACVPRKAIWIDRDAEEQAKSQVKFLRLVTGLTVDSSSCTVRTLAESIERDRTEAVASLGVEPLTLRFERILAQREAVAEELAAFTGLDLDVGAMAAAVRPRHPSCARGMDLEMALIAEER